MNAVLSMRPADPDDEPFMRQLRQEIDSERLFLHMWPEEDEKMARQLLDMQFRAHSTHHKNADWDKKDVIVELDKVPAGRFILMQDSNEIRLADIEVARQFRGMGIGAAIIDGIKGESIQSKRPIRLYVDKHNQAVHFYHQLGFRVIQDCEMNFFMEWTPPTMPDKTQYFFGK